MRASVRALRFGLIVVIASTLGGAAALRVEPAAKERELVRDLAKVAPAEVGVSAPRLQLSSVPRASDPRTTQSRSQLLGPSPAARPHLSSRSGQQASPGGTRR